MLETFDVVGRVISAIINFESGSYELPWWMCLKDSLSKWRTILFSKGFLREVS